MSPRRTALITIIKLTDLAVITASLSLAVAFTTNAPGLIDAVNVLQMRTTVANMLMVGLYLVFWHFVMRACGLYQSYRLSPASREIKDLATAVCVASAPLVPIGLVVGFESMSAKFLGIFPLLAFVCLGTERRLLRAVARHVRTVGRNLRDVVIIGDGGEALEAAAKLVQREALGYRVVEVVTVPPTYSAAYTNGHAPDGNGHAAADTESNGHAIENTALSRLAAVLETRPIDEVFLGIPLDGSEPLLRPVISLCEEQGITVRVVAHLAVLDWGRASLDTLGGQPVITISSGPPDTLRMVVKRLIDLIGAAVGMVMFAPIAAAIAIAIKLDSKGPIFYAQERVGLNRRRFPAYKFRTMVVDADRLQADLEHLNEAEGPVFKIQNDPRVTSIGRWLRRLSLDELPQLVNVLLGDMSLVGPRPLPVRDVSRIDVRWHKRRFSVKPGITCLWQITSREPKFDEWIRSDMEYIDNWSLALDLKILAKTIPAVISGQGAH
jgi:exopolysaccharide biosynthesis polyprenyl glycosylphosphotransferase